MRPTVPATPLPRSGRRHRPPQPASRGSPRAQFDRWKKFDATRRGHAQAALERIRNTAGLSKDTFEVVTRALV